MRTLLLLIVACLLLLTACAREPQGYGVLYGQISIGPFCPAERDPPDPACQLDTAKYASWQLAVYDPDRGVKVQQIALLANNTYRLVLPAGNYRIDFDPVRKLVVGGGNVPSEFIVQSGSVGRFDIQIDTGIR